MCNIAGYVGEKPAVPILVEMLKKQEGLDCGFYTGIVTIHQGKIYCAKVVGDTKHLLTVTNATSLPGTVGFAYSCTKNDEWNHPFLCEREGEIFSAYISSGMVGCFQKYNEIVKDIAEDLLADGYHMRARRPSHEDLIMLSDNTRVHQGDVMCQAISRKIIKGANTIDAMGSAFQEAPKEMAGFLLNVTEGEAITWTRVNYPIYVGKADHGTYMATTPLAFMEDAAEPYLLPVWSSGLVNKDGFTCKTLGKCPSSIAFLTPRVKAEVYRVVKKALIEGNKRQRELVALVKPLFDKADCDQAQAAVCGVLADLCKEGHVKIETEYDYGVFEELRVPVFYLTLEEADHV